MDQINAGLVSRRYITNLTVQKPLNGSVIKFFLGKILRKANANEYVIMLSSLQHKHARCPFKCTSHHTLRRGACLKSKLLTADIYIHIITMDSFNLHAAFKANCFFFLSEPKSYSFRSCLNSGFF